ncbi:MAG: tetraacyldisaccharide 4'-kinase [Thermoflexibacter sp.]
MKLLKFLLFPFAFIYQVITQVRNLLYDYQIFKTTITKPLVISIGNLTVGGTGKTPHVEYLITLLLEKFGNQNLAMLSRGYGRKTKGIIIANQKRINQEISAQTIGDEPMQLFSKFGKEITVCVAENRVKAVEAMLAYQPTIQVVILDDAYQHRAIHRNINILLTDSYQPFYRDFLLPMGRLRESRKGANRADAVIVTKCPDNLTHTDKIKISSQIKKYVRSQTPIFFSTFAYQSPVPLFENYSISAIEEGSNIILLTGIAKTVNLRTYLKPRYKILKHFEFADHFTYEEIHLKAIISYYLVESQKYNCYILTTEKDSVKLLPFQKLLQAYPIFYLPIKVQFLQEEETFNNFVLSKF